MQRAGANQRMTTEIFTERRFNFAETPDDFFVPAYRSMELSLVQLYQETRHARSEDEHTRALTNFYGRISYTLLGLPLLLLGLPLLLAVYRAWGRDLSLAIPVSCGMAFVCWGAYTTLQSLAKAGYVPPLLSAICIHLVVGGVGYFLLLREDR